jgi:energy-coupling factor transport system permease protein
VSAATGYYRFAASWLHRRNPLTKLLGLGWVLLAAFLLPPAVLVLLGLLIGVAAVTSGLLGSLVRSLKIPAVLLASILLVNALLLPGAREMLVSLGPLGLSREGLAFGVVSAARLAIAFGASILFLFTTPADDLL